MTTDNAQLDRLRLQLDEGAQQLGLTLSDEQGNLLIQFVHLLNKWNKVYNLTAVRSLDGMVHRHILDSLSVLNCLPPAASTNQDTSYKVDVLDVGSGGGLPVFPLAIVRPDLQFLSVETAGKKARFQQQAALELNVKNVRVLHERIENTFDKANIIISRAFTAPEKFLLAIEPNCVSGSKVIIMLGQKEKMPAQLPEGFELLELREVRVPNVESIRHVAVCRRL